MKLRESSWPSACLLPDEKRYFSICIGNSSIHWACHGFGSTENPLVAFPQSAKEKDNMNKDVSSNPLRFWRTPHLVHEEIDADLEVDHTIAVADDKNGDRNDHSELLNTLTRHLCTVAKDFLFGRDKPHTLHSATEQNKIRGHLPSFYISSTNKEQTHYFEKILGCIPCRMYLLKPSDFYDDGLISGAYEGMGIDRLANLRGAVGIRGLPALVIDGGTALTYTAADNTGKIIGGGISPGFGMRMRALHEFTSALPNVDVVKYLKDLEEDQHNPPAIFGENTERGMVVSMLNEVSCGMRNVVHSWKTSYDSQVRKRKAGGLKDSNLVNENRTVVTAGGSGTIIHKLLSSNHGDVISDGQDMPNISSQFVNGLQHFGIAMVLCEKSKRDYNKPYIAPSAMDNKSKKQRQKERQAAMDDYLANKKLYDSYLGKKVAKTFTTMDEDGDYVYRGQILSCKMYYDEGGDGPVQPLFRVVYSDGDEEDTSLEDIKDMLELYKKVGPKHLDPDKNPKAFIGKRIAKTFFDDQQIYLGTIKRYSNELWHVAYDDGDAEDFEKAELIKYTRFYEDRRHEFPGEGRVSSS
jgi:pantothenate kinase type III